jgi:prepilin-type N-terminal cleavage/methylation domain-containing protein
MTKPRTYGLVRRSFLGGSGAKNQISHSAIHHSRFAIGFTLIEMLTVLVIISIIIGVGVPAVTNLMKSGGLSAATRQVSNALSFARQCAITRRVYARVVFPYTSTVGQPDMWYRTYAVMTNSDNTVAVNWRYASKWEYLPVGVVFLDRTPAGMAPLPPPPPATGALDDPGSLNQSTLPAGLPFPDGVGALAKLAYVEFTPSGSATPVPLGSLTPSVLAITEGFVTSGSKPTPTSKTSGGLLANVGTITVDSIVGHIKVTRP